MRYWKRVKAELVKQANKSAEERKRVMLQHDITEEEMQDWERRYKEGGIHNLSLKSIRRKNHDATSSRKAAWDLDKDGTGQQPTILGS